MSILDHFWINAKKVNKQQQQNITTTDNKIHTSIYHIHILENQNKIYLERSKRKRTKMETTSYNLYTNSED